MRMFRILIALLAVTASHAVAQKPDGPPPADMRGAEALDLAFQLAEYGRATGNALPLLTAAAIVLDNAPRAIPGADSPLGSALDVTQLLADASRLSANADMTALTETFSRRAAAGVRGATSGPRAAGYQVAPGATRAVQLTFVPRAGAAVRVRAGAGRRVDCEVLDADGRSLASDRATSRCFLNFTPDTAEPVRIVVRNTSATPASIVVITN